MNNYPLRKAEPCFQYLVNRIAKMAGIDQGIKVYACDAPVSCAVFYKEKQPVLCYNPLFIDQLERRCLAAVYAVFSQHVASFHNECLLEVYNADHSGSSFKKKKIQVTIDADEFTGWVLWHEGVQLKEALKLYDFRKFSKSPDPWEENPRKVKMKTGWVQAHNRMLLPPKIEHPYEREEMPEIYPQLIKPESTEAGGIILKIAAIALWAGGVSIFSGRS